VNFVDHLSTCWLVNKDSATWESAVYAYNVTCLFYFTGDQNWAVLLVIKEIMYYLKLWSRVNCDYLFLVPNLVMMSCSHLYAVTHTIEVALLNTYVSVLYGLWSFFAQTKLPADTGGRAV